MRLLRQAVGVLGALIVVAMIAAVVAPKAAHAVAGALVEVTNTAANPVTTISSDAHNSFMAGAGCTFIDTSCSAELYTVPAGKIAVIESASGFCAIESGTAPIDVYVGFPNPQGAQVLVDITPNLPSNGFVVFNQTLKAYASGGSAAGTPIGVTVETNAPESPNLTACRLAISGHLAPQ